jgi:hypothetical protein
VAVELANEGALALDGERLHAFGINTPATVYTGPHFAYDWRDRHAFAEHDEAQTDAAIELTLDLCRRHEIDPVFYYPSTTYDFPRCFQVATIVSASRTGCARRWRRRVTTALSPTMSRPLAIRNVYEPEGHDETPMPPL